MAAASSVRCVTERKKLRGSLHHAAGIGLHVVYLVPIPAGLLRRLEIPTAAEEVLTAHTLSLRPVTVARPAADPGGWRPNICGVGLNSRPPR